MFRYDGIKWVPYAHKITYTQTLEVYDDILSPYPADAVVEDVTLTPEQTKRLEAVTDEIPISDLTAFVMDDADIPGVESYRAGIALETLIDELPDSLVISNLDVILELAQVWKKDTHYLTGQRLSHNGKLYQVRQEHTSQEHQPPDAEGMLAIYLPYNPPGTIVDYDPGRNLAANPYQVGELVRFPYGVYECKRVTNFSPQEYAPDWVKRDDLA